MNHKEIQEKIWQLADRELPEEQRRQLLSHLKGCADCRRLSERWQTIARALAAKPLPEPSTPFVESVMERLPRRRERLPVRLRWELPALSWRFAPAWAAGLGILLLCLSLFQQRTMVGTEALLLAGLPEDVQWVFSEEMPS